MLIGSLSCLCPLRLATVVTLVLVLRYSIENRSKSGKVINNGAIILIKLEKTLLRDMVSSKHYSVYTDNIPSPTHVHFLVTGLNRFTAFLDTTYNSSCTITVQR